MLSTTLMHSLASPFAFLGDTGPVFTARGPRSAGPRGSERSLDNEGGCKSKDKREPCKLTTSEDTQRWKSGSLLPIGVFPGTVIDQEEVAVMLSHSTQGSSGSQLQRSASR